MIQGSKTSMYYYFAIILNTVIIANICTIDHSADDSGRDDVNYSIHNISSTRPIRASDRETNRTDTISIYYCDAQIVSEVPLIN